MRLSKGFTGYSGLRNTNWKVEIWKLGGLRVSLNIKRSTSSRKGKTQVTTLQNGNTQSWKSSFIALIHICYGAC